MSDKLAEMDTVATPEGEGIVVGVLDAGQVEVRYPNEGRRLKIWLTKQVTKVEPRVENIKPIEDVQLQSQGTFTAQGMSQVTPADAYRQAREQGMTPAVDLSQFGEDVAMPPPEPKRSTLAERVAGGEHVPTDRNGRPLRGVALRKHQEKLARES